jgi:hypothetical protein
MITICVILRSEDRYWIKKALNKHNNNSKLMVVAPTLEGMLVAKNLGIKYFSCEEIAWRLNLKKIKKLSRKFAYDVLVNSKIKINSNSKLFNSFFLKKYPLLKMHYSLLSLSFTDAIVSWKYANEIIKYFKPNRIIIGSENNPYDFYENRIKTITNRGSEQLAFKIAAENKSIIIEEISQKINLYFKIKLRLKVFFARFIQLYNLLYYSVFHYFVFVVYRFFLKKKKKIVNNKILFNCLSYNDYYFEQIKNDMLLLKNDGYGIYINFEDKRITLKNYLDLYNSDIIVISNFYKLLIDIKYSFFFKKLNIDIKKITQDIFLKINNYLIKNKLFKDEYGLYSDIVLRPIKKEILSGLKFTINKLLIFEKIVKNLTPKIVISQFDLHADETANIIPAIKNYIPTLGTSHGFGGKFDYIRYTHISDFVIAPGSEIKNIMHKTLKTPKEKIFLLRDERIEKMFFSIADKKIEKRSLGLDPTRPVCVICDMSGWLLSYQYKNSELKTFDEIIKIKEEIPNLQILFRVHHGIDYLIIRKYIESFKIKDIHFQVSSDPTFSKVVKAADVVVAHFCSSIVESIASGVPVIYLTALSYPDKMYYGYRHVSIAKDFYSLRKSIKLIINKKLSQNKVRSESSLFLKIFANLNKNFKNNNLSQILNIIINNNNYKIKKMLDFEKRIYTSAHSKY